MRTISKRWGKGQCQRGRAWDSLNEVGHWTVLQRYIDRMDSLPDGLSNGQCHRVGSIIDSLIEVGHRHNPAEGIT